MILQWNFQWERDGVMGTSSLIGGVIKGILPRRFKRVTIGGKHQYLLRRHDSVAPPLILLREQGGRSPGSGKKTKIPGYFGKMPTLFKQRRAV
ncbi:hypothetical protein NPIL_655831 [Nephila pilipes]|uniref:Uncharacterized protein n=1 Tax=Nephila pilipes TaxID=299642 RepID=A0A8X6JGU3_NEPPI|nr:hypothetical protein NPIL_655831 [Nephila pilipes]